MILLAALRGYNMVKTIFKTCLPFGFCPNYGQNCTTYSYTENKQLSRKIMFLHKFIILHNRTFHKTQQTHRMLL